MHLHKTMKPLHPKPSTIPRKALAGPPEEFAAHALPDPSMGALNSDSAAYFISLTRQGDGSGGWTRTVQVDSLTGFSLNVFSPIQDQLTVSLTDPKGQAVPLDKYSTPTFYPIWDSESQTVKGTAYNIDNPVTGEYILSIKAPRIPFEQADALVRNISGQIVEVKHGYVILYNAGGDRIFSHLAAYTQLQGDQVGLAARMYNAAEGPLVLGQIPNAMVDVVDDAELEAVFPDGHRLKKQMHDDGLHGDGAANDGIYGAAFDASEIGAYTVQATLQGHGANGPFIRTAQHLVQVVPRMLQLTSNAYGHLSGNTLNVFLEVASSTNVENTYRPYFQLWGTSAAGEAVPVGWFSSLEDVMEVDGRAVLALEVDAQWIARAHAQAPFTLRDVYVQEVSAWVPLARAASIPLSLSAGHVEALQRHTAFLHARGYAGAITLAMRQGPTPPGLTSPARNASGSNGGKLIMLHGYCAERNPWQVHAEDWTDALYFLRQKASMPHDEYAQRIVQFAAENQLSSYGLVGHSQGGIVTLHSLNYYFTGLDAATGNRKIQSLASPYNGNTAAGSTADFGKVFGLGCGSNYDMSRDGAVLWMAGISKVALDQANYYTTQYDKGGLFGNGWCNMIVNALINNPNDGTTELVYATLSSGNHRDHTIGQCHIDGMNWPPSFWDHSRNAEMNREAAR